VRQAAGPTASLPTDLGVIAAIVPIAAPAAADVVFSVKILKDISTYRHARAGHSSPPSSKAVAANCLQPAE
jgi:hypothetical protein